MSEWKGYCLADVCSVTDCQHKTAPTVEYQTPFKMLRTSNIRKGKINSMNAKYVTEDVYEEWSVRGKLEKDDVILTREAPMGEVGIIKNDNKFFLGQRMLQLKAKKDVILPDFLYYSLLSPFLQNQIRMHDGVGSVVSNLRIPDLKNFKIKIPKLRVQEKLVSILGALDNKIDLNSQINETLEEMAMALYKHWFVDFGSFQNREFVEPELGMIPKGWEIGNLNDICNIVMGQSPKSEFYNLQKDGMPFHQGVSNFGERYLVHEVYSTKGLRKANLGDILVSVRAPVGRINIADTELIIGRGLAALSSKTNTNSFLYYTLKRVFAIEDQHGSGTVFNSVTKKDMETISVLIPPLEIITQYDKITLRYDHLIRSNFKEVKRLKETRNYLLPRLLSGEIEVKVAEEQVQEVLG